YKSVFGTEFVGEIARMGNVPPQPGKPELTEEEKNMVMHVELPIVGGHSIMGTDVVPSSDLQYRPGNNVTICIQPDSREEMDSLYTKLSEGAENAMEPQDMFWGSYFAAFTDKFGISWMLEYSDPA